MTEQRQDLLFIAGLSVCCLVFFFTCLGSQPLWDIDEGMHASTSRIMVESGDWITPIFNGEPFYDKTVLFNWFVALAFLVFGFTEFAARLPAALLGTGCVLVTYLLGRLLFNRTVGFISGVVLATAVQFIVLSRVVVHDIALVFFITSTLYFFYAGYSSETRRRFNFFFFYVSAGFAVLAKGPIGLLVPAAIIGLFLISRRNLKFIKEMHLGPGIVVFVLIIAPWYLLLSLKNPEYLHYFLIEKNLHSFTGGAGARHPQPFYYYLPRLIGGFFPWSFFLPVALIHGFKGGLKKINDSTLFCLIWFWFIFLFFTVAGSKMSTYILPLYPAVALLVALLWHDLITIPSPRLRRWFLWSSGLYTAFFIFAVVYLRLNPPVKVQYRYGVNLSRVNYIFTVVCLVAIIAFLFFLVRRYKTSFALTAGTIFFLMIPFIIWVVPSINIYRSTKVLGTQLDTLIPPGEKFTFYWQMKDSILFYTGRQATVLTSPDQLAEFLDTDERVYFVTERRRYDPLEQLKEKTYIIWDKGNNLILSNMPDQEAGPR